MHILNVVEGHYGSELLHEFLHLLVLFEVVHKLRRVLTVLIAVLLKLSEKIHGFSRLP